MVSCTRADLECINDCVWWNDNTGCIDSNSLETATRSCDECSEDKDCPTKNCLIDWYGWKSVCESCYDEAVREAGKMCAIRPDDENEGGDKGDTVSSDVDQVTDTDVNVTVINEEKKCFPGEAMVELRTGTKSMNQLEIGDIVYVGNGKYSEVFAFTHKSEDVYHKFLVLKTDSGRELPITNGHYLYINQKLHPARSAMIGKYLSDGNGSKEKILNISVEERKGLYNPQTIQGDIVVNGIVTTTFTEAIDPAAAVVLLSPFRATFKVFWPLNKHIWNKIASVLTLKN